MQNKRVNKVVNSLNDFYPPDDKRGSDLNEVNMTWCRNTLGVSLLGCVNRSAMLCSSWDTIWSALVLMMGAGVVLGAAVVVVVVTVWLDLDLDFLLRDLLDTRNRLKPGAAVVVVVVVVVAARFFLPKILPEKCKETLFDSVNSICKEKEASRTL